MVCHGEAYAYLDSANTHHVVHPCLVYNSADQSVGTTLFPWLSRLTEPGKGFRVIRR